MNEETLSYHVEDLLVRVLAETDYDVDAALARMGGENRTLRALFEAMKDAKENLQ